MKVVLNIRFLSEHKKHDEMHKCCSHVWNHGRLDNVAVVVA